MLQRVDKYFYAPLGQMQGGIDAEICLLELIIDIALSMKRIPIIEERMLTVINDNRTMDIPIDWKRYIDLSKTRILKARSGRIKELPDTLHYIHERDFGLDSYPKNRIRYINSYQLYDEENEQYPVVCLSESEDMKKLREMRLKSRRDFNRMNKISVDDHSSFLVVFSFSQEVNYLTDIVLNYFGTSRESMKLLSYVMLPSFRIKHTRIGYFDKTLNYYACMNVQYRADMGSVPGFIDRYAMRIKVKEVIKKVRSRKNNKIPLYIMSNMMNTNCFNFLKAKHNVYKYTDFRELKDRFTRSKVPDHNLLYLVENNIMRYALVKILPGKMNRFVFEGPWNEIYGIPTLKQKIDRRLKLCIKRFYK